MSEGIVDIATIDVRKMFANPIVKQSDMHDEMKGDAMDCIQTAVDTKPTPEAAAKATHHHHARHDPRLDSSRADRDSPLLDPH